MRRNDGKLTLIVALVAALVGFVVVASLSGRDAGPGPQTDADTRAAASPAPQAAGAPNPATTPRAEEAHNSFLNEMLGGEADISRHESWAVSVPRVTLRLALAALLSTALAFRPRRHIAIRHKRNLYVAQTQILLSVVAAALMMVVGDSAARAFGIFAAASLVRFRTNISDPKEVTVLLIGLAIGLATGVGRWELALVLALFVLPLLWALEYYEPVQAFRALELKVRTRDIATTQRVLKRIFKRHKFNSEVREVNPPEEGETVGCVVYQVHVSLNVTTDLLQEEIMAADRNNVEGIEWEETKSGSYIYK